MSQNKSKIIKYKPPGSFEETRFEKLHNIIYNNPDEGSLSIALSIAQLIKEKQSQKKNCVLGLATGSSPLSVYRELIRMHKEEGLSFKNATSYLKSIEGSAFFNHVRGTSVVTLYNDKEVWDILGYEGASFDKGGYINRGFNDLDWLPEPRIEEHPDHANFFTATQKRLAAVNQNNINQ